MPWLPGRRAVAVIAVIATRDMITRLACRNGTIVAGITGAYGIAVIKRCR